MTHYLDTGIIASYNEAYVATIRAEIVDIADKLDLPIIEDYDDLDTFKAIDLYLEDGFGVQLCRYRGEPEHQVNICFQSQLLNWRERLKQVIEILRIEDKDILAINEDYFRTP